MGGLSMFDYVIVLLYLAAMLGMGLYFSLKQTSSEEYFLARRRLPPFMVGISLIATLLSTISYLALPGDMIQHGIAFATAWVAIPFWIGVVMLVWIPFFMRYRLTSIYEYVQMRFNYPLRLLAASLFVLMRFFWMGVVIYTACDAIAQMTMDVPQHFGWALTQPQWMQCLMLTLGILATGYTFLGGIRVVVWTDVIQFLVMLGGAVFAVVFVWISTSRGPLQWWADAAELQRTTPVLFSLDPTIKRTVLVIALNAFFWCTCTYCSDQVAAQRYFSTGKASKALKSFAFSATGEITLGIVLGLVGLALLSFFKGRLDPQAFAAIATADQAKQVFPNFILNHLPVGVAGLVIAALFAAAMSSVDSGVNSIAAVITHDVYRPLLARRHSAEGNEMWVARLATVTTGLIITAIAFFVALVVARDPDKQNIIDLSPRVFNVFLAPLASIFITGIFFRHVGVWAMGIAVALGCLLGETLSFWELLPWMADLTPRFAHASPSPLLILPVTTTFTLIAAWCLGWLFPRPTPSQIEGHTWRTRRFITERADART